ncbi:two-component system response regulator [Rhodopseudomonas palustris]|uniref:Two-component system response regulator n=1 Tax=Rhodopseudomonas palustris TaxID=1076 RepID=A0A323UD13_RHOPL|nr:HD domain-containing phosphohydrolase [Rhodopseudomonas palustris]PZA10752.1 two-component system response regulator [Rhodopseudomonas palustris]
MLIQALVVDDSRSALEYLTRTIEADGQVHVIAFTDPLQALASARNLDIDIVFVDYEMPHMDGISLIRRLRSLPKFSDVPIVMITSIESDEVRLHALDAGATDFLPKHPKNLETQVRLRNMIRLGSAVRKLNDRAALLASEVARATHALQEREEEIILRLALSVEYRDNDTGDHTLRVAKYSRMIAEGLGLPERLCREIYLAAPLHDVGKVATPDQILLKPGKLTPDEIAVMQTHTTIGASILAGSRCELIRLAADIAVAHHERWDGTGYPNKLKGDEIPIAARIVAVADVFDALSTARPYKEAMPLPVARQHLENGRGLHFDPACVDVFLARWDDVVAIAADRLRLRPTDEAPLQPALNSDVTEPTKSDV